MSSLILFDPNQTPSPVLSYVPSNAVPSDFSGRNDVIFDADLTAVAGQNMRYWKVVAGAVQLMTAQERSAVDAALASALTAAMRSGGISNLAASDSFGVLFRAVADVLISEINALRQRDNDRSTDVAAATSLADLKTRWAARPSLPDRTLSQARTAIQNDINAGTVDS